MELRIIHDEASEGAWNMSVDEALLESAALGTATLRFYRWLRPTLSLGYFQRIADRHSHPPSAQLPVVRRSTGGGAIVHDQELTYSIAMPAASFRSASATRQLYEIVHRAAIEVLIQLGVPARLWSDTSVHKPKHEPFLCFQRRAIGDVVADNKKILGSAQRRSRGALLQHGSLLMRNSVAAPEIDGFEAWLEKSIPPADLAERWGKLLGTELAARSYLGEVTDREQRSAELLQAERFVNSAWTTRR